MWEADVEMERWVGLSQIPQPGWGCGNVEAQKGAYPGVTQE